MDLLDFDFGSSAWDSSLMMQQNLRNLLQTRPIGLDTVETSVGFKVQKLLDSRWWLDDS